MSTNLVLKALNSLEMYHQEVKREYLGWAKDKGLPNNGVPPPDNKELSKKLNKKTGEFLESKCTNVTNIRNELKKIKEFMKGKDHRDRYRMLRELYVIHPSFHELWFFDYHEHLTGRGAITGRQGLNSYVKSLDNGTLNNKRIKSVSTFTLRHAILLENLYSGVLDCSLFDLSLLNKEEMERTMKYLKSIPNPSEDIKGNVQRVLKIARSLLEETDFEALEKDKPLKDWLSYAPCNINQGPIFRSKSTKNRIDILREVHSMEQDEIRNKLKNYFEVTDYGELNTEGD